MADPDCTMAFRAYIPSRVADRVAGTWGGVALAAAGHAAVAAAVVFGSALLAPQTDVRIGEAIVVEIVQVPAPVTPLPTPATAKPRAMPVAPALKSVVPLPVPEPQARFAAPALLVAEPQPAEAEDVAVEADTSVVGPLEPAPRKPVIAPPAVAPALPIDSALIESAPSEPVSVAAAASSPSGVSADRTEAFYAHNPRPAYPAEALRRRQEGRVLLLVDVSSAGRASGVSLRESSGHRLLDKAAVKAVRHWTFLPATRNGVPVASTVEVPVRFFLN